MAAMRPFWGVKKADHAARKVAVFVLAVVFFFV
jgi:hypothetical protein